MRLKPCPTGRRYYDEAPFFVGGSAKKARFQAAAIAELEQAGGGIAP